MKNVVIVDNPFVKNALAYLRDKNTEIKTFRKYADELSGVLISNSLDNLKLSEETIETPIQETSVQKIKNDIVIIPILRAGLSMLSAALNFLPEAKVGFIGLERDLKTAIAREYYLKLPEIIENSLVLITDPMLATGGSIRHLLNSFKNLPHQEIRIICIVASPEGIAAIHQDFPEVQIITAAVDERLNDKKFIVPGLGDFGDRYFGTPELE